jgi:hypothetical protein
MHSSSPPFVLHALPISSSLPSWSNYTWRRVQVMKLLSLVTSSLFGPNTFLNTLFSNTLSLCSSLNVRDQVSHPYRIRGKIIVFYIQIFMFLDSRR